MFHISTLGTAAHHVKGYADQDGYVPEVGDRQNLMHYTAAYTMTMDEWQTWIRNAMLATLKAIDELRSQP